MLHLIATKTIEGAADEVDNECNKVGILASTCPAAAAGKRHAPFLTHMFSFLTEYLQAVSAGAMYLHGRNIQGGG